MGVRLKNITRGVAAPLKEYGSTWSGSELDWIGVGLDRIWRELGLRLKNILRGVAALLKEYGSKNLAKKKPDYLTAVGRFQIARAYTRKNKS